MDKPHITLIGMGLIGSSIGHALKRGELASHITGYARSATTREKALSIGFVDSIADSLQQAVVDADIVFLNVPVGMIADIVKDMAASLKSGAIVTDVGSVKSQSWMPCKRICQKIRLSYLRIRLPEQNFQAPKPVLQNYLIIVGASLHLMQKPINKL